MSERELHPLCVMVGPDDDGMGGVATVIQAYRQVGFFNDGRVDILSSTKQGPMLYKLLVFIRAVVVYVILLIRKRSPVLHVHVCSFTSFWRKAVFIWIARLGRRHIVFHLHGGAFRSFIEGLSGIRRVIAIATMKQCDQILCLTKDMQEWLNELIPGVPVTWWPNPIPHELVCISTPTESREPVVLYLGALLPSKGIFELVDAFAELHGRDGSARLVLGGTGSGQEALNQKIIESGLEDCVLFLGWIGFEDKVTWLQRARVLALASHLEGQPMVLLEAMASGAVVVSTNIGGIPDLIENNVHGLLVNPNDVSEFSEALLSVWNNIPLRQRLTDSAYQKVLKLHKAELVCMALSQLYHQMSGTEEQEA